MNERDLGVKVVCGCLTEGGYSILRVFFWSWSCKTTNEFLWLAKINVIWSGRKCTCAMAIPCHGTHVTLIYGRRYQLWYISMLSLNFHVTLMHIFKEGARFACSLLVFSMLSSLVPRLGWCICHHIGCAADPQTNPLWRDSLMWWQGSCKVETYLA